MTGLPGPRWPSRVGRLVAHGVRLVALGAVILSLVALAVTPGPPAPDEAWPGPR